MKSPLFIRIFLLSVFGLLPAICDAQSNILVLGDSLSAGYGIPRDAAWPNLLQTELQRTHPHYKVVNASISGETTSGGLQRLPAVLKEHHPRIVIIELGANDGLRGTRLELTENNLDQLIMQCKSVQAKVLLIGMQLPPNYGAEYAQRFRRLYSRLASRHHTGVVPFLLEGVEPEEFQADNLHPTAQAQPKILKTVMRQLKQLLE